MATVAQFNQDEEDQTRSGNQTGGGGQVLSSNAGDASGGGGGAQTAGSATPQRAPLGHTPNIQQYLQANQGAGQQLASGIQGNVQRQANKVGQNLNTYQQQLAGQYNPLQQTEQQGQQVIQSAFQNPQQLLDAYNTSQSQQNGQPLSGDQQNSVQQYNQFQSYNNPNAAGGLNSQIANYGSTGQMANTDLRNQAAGLQQQANQAATESGRFGLLQQSVGQPTYSSGQQTLDALFLQAQPGVARQLQQNLGGIAQGTNQQIGGLTNDVQNKLSALQGLSAQNKQQIDRQFGGALSDIDKNVQGEIAAGTAAAADQPRLAAALKANQGLTPEDLNKLGLGDVSNIYNLDLNQYFTPGQKAVPTASDVASNDEISRYNALQQLSNPNMANIFGGAKENTGWSPYNLDVNKLKTDIGAQQKYYNELPGNEINTLVGQIGGWFGQTTPAIGFGAATPWGGAAGTFANQLLGLKNPSNDKGGMAPTDQIAGIQNYINQYSQATGQDPIAVARLMGFDKISQDYNTATNRTLNNPNTASGK